MFTKQFDKYVCNGDSITCEIDGFDVTATLHYDDDTTPPDKRSDGFWPSKNPKDAGYVLPENYESEMAKAKNVMHAWERDEWHYYGVAVTVSRNDVLLTGPYDHALWGIEGNWPGSDNNYFRDVANDLLPDAIDAAKATIKKLCA